MAWLFDTYVLSELRRPRPDPKVLAFVESCNLRQRYVSCVTLAELRFGIAMLADSERRADLSLWLEQEVRPRFRERVLDITEATMLRWRFLVEDGRKVGRTFSQPDLLIAATALEHRLTLVTRNVKDFSGLGVTVLNPWE